ncbi:hypothetical protein PPROV_000543600 [Pycnococcus provasolii]|uniref:Dihydrolipoyl dehydrogenase n=1 Tax=Pycnococcus provasolii TaxID=41880 RepID=A0A830HM92_9CHLO|nr:hypothetical protein PPROV_000543600 [Pycnococcus provasolii]
MRETLLFPQPAYVNNNTHKRKKDASADMSVAMASFATRMVKRVTVLSTKQLAPLASQTAAMQLARPFASAAAGEMQDLVVIGGGPGGYVAAIKAAQLGMKVTCVEGRGSLGGTCLNVGCIPSKALLNASHHYHDAKHNFEKYGITVGDVSISVEGMMKSKDDAVTGLTSGIEGLFKKNKVTYSKGWGSIPKSGEVKVALSEGGEETIQTKNILIATGSEVTPLPGVPIDEERIVSSTGAIALKEVPKHLVCIGGGIIGLEMASVWSRLGAQITVVEFLPHMVPSMDGEIRKTMERQLKKEGFKFKYKTKVTAAERNGDSIKLTIEPAAGGDAETLECDYALVSIGRRPFTEGLGLEALGVKMNRGMIEVDHDFKTNVPGIYAIGDCIPGPMLAHKAEEDGVACVETMAGKHGHVNYANVPSILYTHPEVAWVGLTEEQCKEQGIEYTKGTFSMMANSRARANNDAAGMVKFVAEKGTDKILGAHIMGNAAGELIMECALAMEYGGSTEDIARVCHGHPTLSEAVKEAAMATYDKPIHM